MAAWRNNTAKGLIFCCLDAIMHPLGQEAPTKTQKCFQSDIFIRDRECVHKKAYGFSEGRLYVFFVFTWKSPYKNNK